MESVLLRIRERPSASVCQWPSPLVEEAEAEGPFDPVGPIFKDADPRLWEPIVPGSDRNQFSYLVDFVIDKIDKNISTEYANLRLRREASAYQSDGPTSWRRLLKLLETRPLQSIVRHRCQNDDCSYGWIGPCDPKDVDPEDECPLCHTPRYKRVGGKWKARHFWYLGLDRAIAKMHCNPLWRENFKRNMDISDNAYRQSPDGKRLHAATYGESSLPGSGLYTLYHDGVLPNDTATQSITAIGVSCLDISDEVFSKLCNEEPVAIFDIPEPKQPSTTLKELFLDMRRLGEQGMMLPCPISKQIEVKKCFFPGWAADTPARYVPYPYVTPCSNARIMGRTT